MKAPLHHIETTDTPLIASTNLVAPSPKKSVSPIKLRFTTSAYPNSFLDSPLAPPDILNYERDQFNHSSTYQTPQLETSSFQPSLQLGLSPTTVPNKKITFASPTYASDIAEEELLQILSSPTPKSIFEYVTTCLKEATVFPSTELRAQKKAMFSKRAKSTSTLPDLEDLHSHRDSMHKQKTVPNLLSTAENEGGKRGFRLGDVKEMVSPSPIQRAENPMCWDPRFSGAENGSRFAPRRRSFSYNDSVGYAF